MTKEKNEEEKTRLDWHSGFEGGLRLCLRKYSDVVEIEREHSLSSEPLRIDFLVIKKKSHVLINNSIGCYFRKYNIVEYKNPNDELNIDVLWKIIGYACLFKSFGKTVDEIGSNELTVSIFRAVKPIGLFKHLENTDKKVKLVQPGVYKICGIIDDIEVRVIVISELEDNELIALSVMNFNADEDKVREFLQEVSEFTASGDKRNADAVLQISANINRRLFDRLRGDEKMCEALREIMAEDLQKAESIGVEKGMEKGIEQGTVIQLIKQVSRKLSKGTDPAEIADILEESPEDIQMICNIATKYAPDYDVNKIYSELRKAKESIQI